MNEHGVAMADLITDHFNRSADLVNRTVADPEFMDMVKDIAATISAGFRAGARLMLAGNGGSAADAQHIAGEFLSRLNFDRAPLPALALTVDPAVLTAIGNDYGFDRIFERQLRGLARDGDIFIAISTSGRSPNVISALKAAREIGMVTIGFTGKGRDEMAALCDKVLAVPADETALIQQLHMVAAHAICGQVERDLFPAR